MIVRVPSPLRVWQAFRVLHTVFLVVRRRTRFLGLAPLSPEALRAQIVGLGVAFLKLAQVLATRPDFFPPEHLAQLKTIHDELAPMPREDFLQVYAAAFGGVPGSPSGPFISFEETPLASASIGQVHRAVLPSGEVVAVKLRRRGIQGQVRQDIRILKGLLWCFSPFFSRDTRNSLEALIAEFAAMVVKEADMAVELEHLEKFREAYARLGEELGVVLPRPFRGLCSHDALVMSFEPGMRIDDRAALEAADIDFARVMGTLVKFYVEQMLVRGFFHCDPHPGNLLVREDGTLVLLDFGMVRRLGKTTRVAMIEVVKSAHERDLETFVAACKRLGIIAPGASETLMLEFAERMFAIFGNDNLSATDMQTLAFDVLASMQELPFKLPQEIVYVTRVSSLVEGLGATYLDNFNGVKDILPVLFLNLDRALGGGEALWPSLKAEILGLPLQWRRAKQVLLQLADSNLEVRLSPHTLECLLDALAARCRPLAQSALLVAAGFFLLQFEEISRGWAVAAFAAGVLRGWLALR
ncbi:ABC1 kinase family protein [Megalodesulfovibrio paquesii]